MRDRLINLKNEALALAIQSSTPEELERLHNQYLGKNGSLNSISKEFKQLSSEERADIGNLFNDVKAAIEMAVSPANNPPGLPQNSKSDFESTLPGLDIPLGHLHPVTQAISEITSVFEKIGFTRVRYPEVDWDWYAFTSLNFPDNHPARDDWETYFIDTPPNSHFGRMLLTPHTSNGQVREMQHVKKPPVRMINIAKCYRRQSDVSHTTMFHQFEGLVIDKNISITNLKGTTDYFVQAFFGPGRTTRLRPYHFQFTEPSFEVDISCGICNGTGKLKDGQSCRLCKEGWLELGGAGMVHPNVLKSGDIDPKIYSGFAFGWGVERTYMMKSGANIDDLRLLYENDIRFLNQF